MQKRTLTITTLAILAGFALTVSAQGLSEDFESYDHATPIEKIDNWQADTAGNDATAIKVRQTSMSGEKGDGGIGAAGHDDSKGLEFSNQKSARLALADDQIIKTDQGPDTVFEARVRLSDIQGTGRKSTPNHSFAMLLGENIGWDKSQPNDEVIALDESAALTVIFYQRRGERSIRVSNGTKGTDINGEAFMLANTRPAPDSQWDFNAWYTVRIRNIQLKTAGTGHNVNAVLDIIGPDGQTKLVDGMKFNANKGSAQPASGAFDQIDSLALYNILGNGLVNVDDLSLSVSED